MKITFKDRRPKEVRLDSLLRGEIFKLPTGETAYMVLNDHRRYFNDPVVNLANGNVYEFEPSRQVVRLEGEVIAEEDGE